MAKKRKRPKQPAAVFDWSAKVQGQTPAPQGTIPSTPEISSPSLDKLNTINTGSPASLRAEMETSNEHLVRRIARLFNNPEHADTKIYIGSFELPAHRLVLCIHSPFFEKALNGGFKESKTNCFRFEEGSAHAYWRVFEYMYTGKYSEETHSILGVEDDDKLMKDARVYFMADFFLMDTLKDYALRRFTSTLRLLGIIDELWVDDLRFCNCIREIYDSTNESDQIRKAIVQVVKKHMNKISSKKSFQDLIYEGGDFAVDLLTKPLNTK